MKPTLWVPQSERMGGCMLSEADIKQISRMMDVNHRRLEQIQDQISRLEIVQAEHADVETSLMKMEEGEGNAMIPIGAGVHLPTQITTNSTAVIDVGSGVFAEKKPTEAAEIIRNRIADIGMLINELTNEAKAISDKIRELSESFNKTSQVEETTQVEEITPSKKTGKKQRGGGFGGELTLDD